MNEGAGDALALPVADLSEDVRPQDDLWGFVNGAWLAGDPIPPDRARWGLSDIKRDRISRLLRELVESADRWSDTVEERTVARLYDSYNDREARTTNGMKPVADELAEINGISDVADVLSVLGRRQRGGVPGLCTFSAQPDAGDPTRWSVHLFQAGLSLPAASMYARFGPALSATAEQLLGVCGLGQDLAARAVDLEFALADVSWVKPYGDDDLAITNPFSWRHLESLVGVELAPLLQQMGLSHAYELNLNVCQPSYWEGLGALLRDRSVEDWRAWLTWRLVHSRAPVLTPDTEEIVDDFFVRTLRGQEEPTPRWRRAVKSCRISAVTRWAGCTSRGTSNPRPRSSLTISPSSCVTSSAVRYMTVPGSHRAPGR